MNSERTRKIYNRLNELQKKSGLIPQEWIKTLTRSTQPQAKAAMIFYDKLSKDFKIEKYVAVSHRSLTQKEVDIILNKLEGKTLLQNIIIIFINTGVRRSELEELITKYKENSNTNVIDIIGKGDKKRGVFLNKEAKEALDKIKGMEFKINSQATILWGMKKEIGIDFSFHNLRATFANNLKDMGWDVHTIKDLLGHEDLGTTDKYISSSSTRKLEAVSSLTELQKGNFSKQELLQMYIKLLMKFKKQKAWIELMNKEKEGNNVKQ